jgi:hypothetical protein
MSDRRELRDDQRRPRLPRAVEEQVRRARELDAPPHLLGAVMSRIEDLDVPQPGGARRWWPRVGLGAGLAAVAAVAIAIVILRPSAEPPIGDPNASATPTPTTLESTPPPFESLPVAGTIEDTFELPGQFGMGAYGHGSLWLASEVPGTLARVNPASGEIEALIEISGPVTRPYNMAPAVDDRWVWASAGEDSAIVRIDPRTNEVVDRYPVDAMGYQMLATGTDVYMTDFDRELLVHIDADSGAIEDRLQLPGGPSGLALTDEGLWVSLWRQQRLLLMSPETLQTLEEHDIALSSISLTPARDDLWISGNNARPLERFSISERRVVARTTEMGLAFLDGQPWGITFEGQLVRLDAATLAWTAGLQLDLGTCDCANILAGDDRLYVGAGDRIFVVAAR